MVTPDIYSGLFTAITLGAALVLLRREAVRFYLLAGLAAGLTVGSSTTQPSSPSRSWLRTCSAVDAHGGREVLVVVAFALPYALLVGSEQVHFARNLMPLLPAVGLLAGFGLALLVGTAAQRVRYGSGSVRRPRVISLAPLGTGRYPLESARYRQMEEGYCRAASFDEGPWIRIYVPCPPGVRPRLVKAHRRKT